MSAFADKLPDGKITAAPQPGAELTVVIPTFNERDNILVVMQRLANVLNGINWEVIFVDDDSADDTASVIRVVARRDRRVRVIHRIRRRGLSSACVEGVLSSSAPYIAVMDADGQHDVRLLPKMLHLLREEKLDIVVGSRYVVAGSVEGWNAKRAAMSRVAGSIAKIVVKADVQDLMSGFFMLRRETFEEAVRGLSQQGFKIMFDLFASAPRTLRFVELPYHFLPRQFGKSKFDGMAAWEFGVLVLDKLFGRFVPARLVLFGLVGATGLIVHLATLGLVREINAHFAFAQTVAVIVAMTWNFFLNNIITYRDRRMKGWNMLRGLVSFYLLCSVGAVANVGVASALFGLGEVWWVAGLAGALVGTVWNYAATSFFTWRQ